MSASSHWRRFVSSCGSQSSIHNQPGNGHLLRKSPSEWQRYSVLLRSCPAARMAMLDYLTPIFVDYFVMWWQRHAQSDRPARAVDTSNEMLEDLYTAETMLCDLVHLLRELVTSPNASEQFVSTVCSWCLARLRPIYMVPPTQLLAQLRRLLQSAATGAATAARSRCVGSAARVDSLPLARTVLASRSDGVNGLGRGGVRSTKPILDVLSRVREGSPFSDGTGPAHLRGLASSSDSELTSDTDADEEDEDEIDVEDGVDDDGNAATLLSVPPVSQSTAKDIKLLLDFNPDSSANKQLLGSWSRCPLLLDMLHLTYELLLGSCARLSTVQALLASATIPVPPELTSVAGYHPPPTAVLPHWVITWLTYQSYRIMYAGTATDVTTTTVRSPICRFVRLVLDAATRPPPPISTAQSSSTTPDTVAGWYGEQRVDVQFWISSCLTHLLFLGDETPALVYNWLVEKLDALTNNHSVSSSDCSVCPIGLLHVLLRLGLSTVPIPPSVPTALEPPSGSAGIGATPATNQTGAPTTSAVFMPPSAAAVVAAAAVRFPGAVNYTAGFGQHPSDHMGRTPTGMMHHPSGGAMPPYYLQTLRRPATGGVGPFPLSNPPPLALFNVAQPPGPNMHSIPNSCAHGPPPPFCSNITRPPDAPTRLSMHRPRRHMRSAGELDTEWTMCTPTRRPASLVWLLNLARLLRVAAITALDRTISHLTTTRSLLPLLTVLARLFRDSANGSDLSAQGSVLFQMATEMLLTAPAIAGYKKLVIFLFDTLVGGSDLDSDSNQNVELIRSFRTVCAGLLQSAAVTCLSMVHSCSELADSLNRGGCEGLLSTAQQLAIPCSADLVGTGSSARSNTLASSSSSTLFHLLVGPDPHVALVAAHLLVALALTIEPNLSENMLVQLCRCNSDATTNKPADGNSQSQYTPLLLFFPILDELETGWAARRAHRSDKSTEIPWIPTELIPRATNDPTTYRPNRSGAYMVHELLSGQVLPRLWDRVSNASVSRAEALSVLRALVWLVRREDALVRSRLSRPRLQVALGAQIKSLLTLMNTQLDCGELANSLLTLFKYAIASHASKATVLHNLSVGGTAHAKELSSARIGPGTRATASHGPVRSESRCLPASLAVRAGRQLVCSAAKLLRHVQTLDTNPAQAAHRARQLERVEQALILLLSNPESGGLVRSAAIRCICEPDNIRLFYPSYQSEMDAVNSAGRNRLREVDEQLVDVRHLASLDQRSAPQSSGLSLLLLFNPAPATTSADDDDDLARGYLRAPAASRFKRGRSVDPCKRPPGTAFNAFATDSPCEGSRPEFRLSVDTQKLSTSSVPCPHWLHWLRLTNRIISNGSGFPRVTSVQDHQRIGGQSLAASLQHILLPHGLHLPQTSIWQLPEQIPLVLPPSGVGLERVIRLMHQFCPQVKAQAIGHLGSLCKEARGQVWLIQSLFRTPLEMEQPLFGETIVNSAPVNSTGADPFHLPDWMQRPAVHFPYPQLLLGLLMGLEAAWASPLAPRISIPDAVTFLTSHDGRYAQGVFPCLGASELLPFHARKLAVDYAQRRVDCRTDLFRFTKQLLMTLFTISHAQDCATIAQSTANTVKSKDHPTPQLLPGSESGNGFHSLLPLDRLLYCLNPRELSILLSDVRRNLRLRLAFNWLRDCQKQGHCLPPALSIVASKTLDALGGSVPPAPAFITPGLLLALLQSHLTEPGVAGLVGPLLLAVRMLQPPPAVEVEPETADTDSVVEEIDVNGELMVVLND